MVKMVQLDPDEKVILQIRKHVLPFIFEVSFLAVLIFIPPILYVGSQWFEYADFISGIRQLFLFGYTSLLLFVWISFFIAWTNYYLDVLIVTNKRIIDIEQKRFFYRDIATLSLDKIEDIKVEIGGFLATLLNYGTLNIQTAAESREFIIKHVPHPLKTKDAIWDLHVKTVNEPKEVKVIQ